MAVELINIFCIFGPPSILQANNGKEFSHAAGKSRQVVLDDEVNKCYEMFSYPGGLTNSLFSIKKFCNGVVREIKRLWPGTVLVTGKPCHSESNGEVERRNCTVEDKNLQLDA